MRLREGYNEQKQVRQPTLPLLVAGIKGHRPNAARFPRLVNPSQETRCLKTSRL